MRLLYPLRLLATLCLLWLALKRGCLSTALERLGPSYIKLGQLLSTRPDLIGEKRADELAHLRDRLPPFRFAQARRIIEEEFGKKLEAIFASIEEVPVAAASVAQVHSARLLSGERVAAKILRPGVARAFEKDIALFDWAARTLMRLRPGMRRLKLTEVVNLLRETVTFELDLRYEAAAMDEMRANVAGDSGWRIPRVYWQVAARRVLVSEWIDGVPIHEREALLAAGHNPDVVLAALARHFFLHVFRDGFFHADLHPGNVFVDAAGNIVVVDFGIMGRLSRRERNYIAEMFRGFLQEDYKAVAEAHFRAGYVPAHQSKERFAQAAMAIAKPIFNRPANEISLAKLLEQLFSVAKTFEMQTQPQLLLLQKTLVTVEGVGRMLNPSANMWDMARSPIEEWAKAEFSPAGRAKHALAEVKEWIEEWLLAYHSRP